MPIAQLLQGLLAKLARVLGMGAGGGGPVGMGQALLELGCLVMAQDGSIVGGQLPLLGPPGTPPSGGGGPIGRSRPTSAAVAGLGGPPDSTMALLNRCRVGVLLAR